MASVSKLNLVPYTLTLDQEEPGTEDVQTPDIVLHNHFRSRSCIGTSMQFPTQCVAPAYQLLPQDSAPFALCVRYPRPFCFPAPWPHSLKMEATQRHQTREQAVLGLGVLPCTRQTRAHLVNMLVELCLEMAIKNLIRQLFLGRKMQVIKREAGNQEVIKRQAGPHALAGVLQPLWTSI